MVGRSIFLSFGVGLLLVNWGVSNSDDDAAKQRLHRDTAVVAIGLILGGVACGAAEGSRARNGRGAVMGPPPGWYPVPGQGTSSHPPPATMPYAQSPVPPTTDGPTPWPGATQR